MITFAVVGHNEVELLGGALDQAKAAATVGDRVVFVDSGSTDGSPQEARALGYDVLPAPIGKGRAVRSLMAAAGTPWVCLLDADIEASEGDLPIVLADAVRADPGAAMVLGDFRDKGPTVLSNTWVIYEPMVAALFPEAVQHSVEHPLTGFRAVRVDAAGPVAEMPPGFGIEAHLNVVCTGSGRVGLVDLGCYEGPFRYKPAMGWEIAEALLASAVRTGRLAPGQVRDWWPWILEATTVISRYTGEPSERAPFLAELDRLRARPTPTGPGSHA